MFSFTRKHQRTTPFPFSLHSWSRFHHNLVLDSSVHRDLLAIVLRLSLCPFSCSLSSGNQRFLYVNSGPRVLHLGHASFDSSCWDLYHRCVLGFYVSCHRARVLPQRVVGCNSITWLGDFWTDSWTIRSSFFWGGNILSPNICLSDMWVIVFVILWTISVHLD